jgi:hypothetical protein
MGISSMFNHESGRPADRGNNFFLPVNAEKVLEPITDREEFNRLHSFLHEENFVGSFIRETIGIGLNNIRFDEEDKLFKINVNIGIYFPEDNKPSNTKTVNLVIKLDDLYKPKYKDILLCTKQDVNKFWDSISNALKHWYPSVDNGLPDEAARENLINDIQRRSLTSLLDDTIMPSLQKHLRESNDEGVEHFKQSLNNSPPRLSPYKKIRIFNPKNPTTPLAQGYRKLKIHPRRSLPSVSDLSRKRTEEIWKMIHQGNPELN